MRLVLLVLLLAVPAAQAARPFVTDDARVVDPGGCQIEMFYKRQREFHEHEFGLLPACNPWGRVELSLGGIWVDSSLPGNSQTILVQAKTLLKPLDTNGSGFAFTLGVGRVRPFEAPRFANPYFTGIGSFSLFDDRLVVHANLGVVRDKQSDLTRGTWGVGAEVLLLAPRLYGIIELYGQRKDKPTLHTGLRFWIVPDRLQVDGTVGRQYATPFDRRFGTIGLRVLW